MSVADLPDDRSRRTRTTTFGGAARLLFRRLRLEPGAPLAMLVLVSATCFLFAALPRLFNNFADDGLRYEVVHAAPLARNVHALEWGRLDSSGRARPLQAVADRAARMQQALPPSLRGLIGERAFVVRSPRYVLEPDGDAIPAVAGLTRYLTIHLQSGVRPHLRLIAGRLPRDSQVRVRAPMAARLFLSLPGRSTTLPGLSTTQEVPLVEVALSTATARLLRLHVGDRAVFAPDLEDVAVQRSPLRDERPLAVEVTGLVTIEDPRSSFWFGDRTLGTPVVRRSQDLEMTWVYAQALVSSSGYARMLSATEPLPLGYEYRYFVEAARMDAGELERLSDDVAGLDARYTGAGALEPRVETALASVLDGYRRARSQAETLLAVAAIGLLACALANVGLLAALWYERRRREIWLSRTRGASSRQVLSTQAAEALLLAAPAALAGWAVAVLAIDARNSRLSLWFTLAIVFGTAAVLVAVVAGAARRPIVPLSREDAAITRPSQRRLVIEGLVAVTAVLGAFLLHRRGLEASGGDGAFDPYLAGVPVLLALACGIVALRLYPLAIAGAARLARHGRGLAIHLGLSRAARQPDLYLTPLLVLLLALTIAAFSSTMLSTLEAGQDRTGLRAIGSESRVDAPVGQSLPPRLLSRLESIGTVARAYVQDAGLGEGAGPTPLLGLDLAAYERVVSDSPAAVRFPRELRAPPPIPGVVPALVSTGWSGGGFFQVELPHGTVGLAAVTERASFPGIPPETPFVVVPLGALEEAAGKPLPPSRLYVRGASAAAVRQAVEEEAPRADVGSRSAVVADLRASPLVDRALRGFRAAIVLAALYAGLAVVLMAVIAARSRARDLALVRTMGGSSRDALVLAAVELTPFVASALLVGIGLGIALTYLIAPELDLSFYTGDSSNPIVIPWLAAAALVLGLVLLVSATVLLLGMRARRVRLDRVLRIGER
jgi:putative ABC transport system permease protein